MARSIVARRHGDDFQARLFWLKAVSLLDPNSPVVKVTYETGPKSFDDIQIEYDPKTAPLDHEGGSSTAGTFSASGTRLPACSGIRI